MRTPYTYELPDGELITLEFPMGTAPREVAIGPETARRVFGDALIKFTYGKEAFHGPTIGERVEKQLKDAPNAEFVGSRWV